MYQSQPRTSNVPPTRGRNGRKYGGKGSIIGWRAIGRGSSRQINVRRGPQKYAKGTEVDLPSRVRRSSRFMCWSHTDWPRKNQRIHISLSSLSSKFVSLTCARLSCSHSFVLTLSLAYTLYLLCAYLGARCRWNKYADHNVSTVNFCSIVLNNRVS